MSQIEHAIKAIRINGIEAVTKAKSGHPGIVLGAAPALTTLFANHINFDPQNPSYFNRDRFVLSAGHGSALLYALFAAVQIEGSKVENLATFRQLHSVFAGHPERTHLPGVEITTGPLGQGVGAAVGLAIAEAHLGALFQVNNQPVIDHYTYCLFGDGCMQEGLFHEALSVACFYNLHKLIFLYDSNQIQLDGPTKNSESINKAKYFEALKVDYQFVKDGENLDALNQAIVQAKASKRVSVIEIQTVIGAHSTKAGTSAVHGAPLSQTEIDQVRQNLNYHEPAFTYTKQVYEAFDNLKARAAKNVQAFQERLNCLQKADLKKYQLLEKLMKNEFNLDFIAEAKQLEYAKEASRNIVGQVYQLVTKHNPSLITLNADLSVSTKIIHNKQAHATANDYLAPNWNVGAREFAMQAINNGISAHGGMLAAGSTFLAFADYTKPALRLGAISKLNTMTIFSHDSITVGEDGPTHQPIEQLWMLRNIPDTYTARPANAIEAAAAFNLWLKPKAHKPVVITSSRAPFTVPNFKNIKDVDRGAYVVYGTKESEVDLVLLATGSEVDLAIEVAKLLEKQHSKVRVVSVWCVELFEEQGYEFVEEILGSGVRVSIEFGITNGWASFVDFQVGIDHFGVSANADDIIAAWSLNPTAIADELTKILCEQK